MAERSIKQTEEQYPDLCGETRVSARAERAMLRQRIEQKYGQSVLDALAELAFTGKDKRLRLRALHTLAPYLHAQMKAVEITGSDGERLVVEVRRVDTPSTPAATPAAQGDPA